MQTYQQRKNCVHQFGIGPAYRHSDLLTDEYNCLCVCLMTGRHQNLQAEVARLSEREAALQSDNQRLQQTVIQLEKVSC